MLKLILFVFIPIVSFSNTNLVEVDDITHHFKIDYGENSPLIIQPRDSFNAYSLDDLIKSNNVIVISRIFKKRKNRGNKEERRKIVNVSKIIGTIKIEEEDLVDLDDKLTLNLGIQKNLSRKVNKVKVWLATDESIFCEDGIITGNGYRKKEITNFFSPILMAGDQAKKLMSFFRLSGNNDGGLVIDVIPKTYEQEKRYFPKFIGAIKQYTKNDDYHFTLFGLKLGKKENRINLAVSDFSELTGLLNKLPDFSIKRLNILSHMSNGSIDGIRGDYESLGLIGRKFMHNGSINFHGCSFANGELGQEAMNDVSKMIFKETVGVVRGFKTISTNYMFGLEYPLALDVRDIFSIGGKIEIENDLSGRRCLVNTKAVYSTLR